MKQTDITQLFLAHEEHDNLKIQSTNHSVTYNKGKILIK